jgi:hypothetical protein
MCVHLLLWLPFGFNMHKWNPGFITCDWEICHHLCGITVKKYTKRNPFSVFCAHLWAFSEPILHRTCDSVAVIISWRTVWNLWRFTWKFWNCEVPSFTNFLVSALNRIITHCRWPTTFYTIVLQFFHSLHFGYKPRLIHDGFPHHSCFLHEEGG